MKNYTVTSPTGVTISSGILLLTDAQAKPRAHALADLGEGLYEVRLPVQFKCGEPFGYDGEVNKALLEEMAPAEPSEEQAAEPAEIGRRKK